MSAPEHLRDLVVSEPTLSEWVNGNTFCYRQPDAPDKVLTFYEYVGTPEYVLGQGNPVYEMVRVQARVRAATYPEARASLITLRTFLNNFSGTLSGIKYSRIMCDDTPTPLEPDQKDRDALVLNFMIMKEPS